MSSILRPPLITRIWPRDPNGVAVNAQTAVWQNPLLNTLAGQDKFFGAGGPTYDYPNPRGYPFPIVNRTIALFPLQLIGKDQFFGAGGPTYDYPNPRAPAYPSDLRTWIVGLPLTLRPPQPTAVAGHPNYDQPNPNLGRPFPISLRGFIHQGNIQLGNVVGAPALAFASDIPLTTCLASDSPSGQNWSGDGFMGIYQIDSSIQLNGVFRDAQKHVYVDPSSVNMWLLDPAGNLTNHTVLDGSVTRDSTGHYHYTLIPSVSGTWTYKWQGTGVAVATSLDTTFQVSSSNLISG